MVEKVALQINATSRCMPARLEVAKGGGKQSITKLIFTTSILIEMPSPLS
jgi:hypothetical protein